MNENLAILVTWISFSIASPIVLAQAVDQKSNTRPDAGYIIGRADRDRNGQISREEVQYLHGAGDGRGAWRVIKNHFEELDVNKDGELNGDELNSGFARPDLDLERQNRAEGMRRGLAQ